MAGKIRLPLEEDQRAVWDRNRRRNKYLLILLLVALTTMATFSGYVIGLFSNYTDALLRSRTQLMPSTKRPSLSDASTASTPSTSTKYGDLVPLEAHIMSKCPDTKICLRELLLPAMIQVHDKVDFKLTYLGLPTENDGVECKHGPEECMGDIIELCAHYLYPDPKIWLGFTMCLTKDYPDIPQRELVEDCALEHAVDFKKLNECATRDDGAFGMGMLRASVERSASLGIKHSCTVRLNNETYCVHINGEWIDCPTGPGVNDLVIAIEKLYRS